MKEVTVTYKVYTFDELSEEARERAINDEIKFYLEAYSYEDIPEEMQHAIDKAEKMQTPWFTGEYIWEDCKEFILDGCRQYDYTADGKVFPCAEE
mgnify:CR=1 FL=1